MSELNELLMWAKKTGAPDSLLKRVKREISQTETRLSKAERAIEASLIASANAMGDDDGLLERMEKIGAQGVWCDSLIDLREWADEQAKEYQRIYEVTYAHEV